MNKELIKLNIQKLRNKAGISQNELASGIFSTKQNISKYERGEVTPPTSILIDIATFFNVTLDELVNDYLISDKLNIKLDYATFLRNYNVNILNENISNIVLENNIYIPNINKELAVIDNYEDVPRVEYIKDHKILDVLDFSSTIKGTYDRNLRNSEIHHTDSLLMVSELLKIINSLGANYDYSQKPGSMKLEITDEFIAYVKLCSISKISNGKVQIELEYTDLLISQYRHYYDVTFSEIGYKKNRDRVSSLIKEIYNEEFKVDKIDAPMDEAHFLQYIVENRDDLPKSLNNLYIEFNNKSSDLYYEIGNAFIKIFTEKTMNKLLPGIFDFKVNYNLRKPRISMNGIMNDISKSANNANQASYINYLITELHDEINMNDLWKESFDEYALSLGLIYVEEDFFNFNFGKRILIQRSNKDDLMSRYNDFIKTRWVFNNVKLLDIKTLKIIKSIIYKEVIK